jgi:hypothetical protein
MGVHRAIGIRISPAQLRGDEPAEFAVFSAEDEDSEAVVGPDDLVAGGQACDGGGETDMDAVVCC